MNIGQIRDMIFVSPDPAKRVRLVMLFVCIAAVLPLGL